MERLYSFYDYEEAYYHMRYYDCKKIGLYLLSFIKNEKSKKLYNQLKQMEYSWDMPEREAKKLAQLLFDVKVWLMVHENY